MDRHFVQPYGQKDEYGEGPMLAQEQTADEKDRHRRVRQMQHVTEVLEASRHHD